MIQVEEFKYAEELNEWVKANNDSIEIIEIKYVGNRHYGTAILLIYKKDS